MSDVLTIAEIEAQFVAEWVLVEDPQTNDALEVQGGKILYHSKDRDEVYREAVRLRMVHRRKPQPRCDVLFLAHGNGGKPHIRLARPPQPQYGRQGLTLSLIRPHGFPTMRA